MEIEIKDKRPCNKYEAKKQDNCKWVFVKTATVAIVATTVFL